MGETGVEFNSGRWRRDGRGKGRGSASTPLEVPSNFSAVVAPMVCVSICPQASHNPVIHAHFTEFSMVVACGRAWLGNPLTRKGRILKVAHLWAASRTKSGVAKSDVYDCLVCIRQRATVL